MNRRNFLGGMAGILAAGFAPAIGHAGILMPVKKIAPPEFGLAQLREIAASLRAADDAARGASAAYFVIVHPNDVWDLRQLPDFVPVVKYAALKPMHGEIGSLAFNGTPYQRIIAQSEIYT
jgi:hypothetical protein